MSKMLRVGVIGVGGRGILAHNAHEPDKGIKLVAGADVNEAHLEEFGRLFGPEVFLTQDYRELIEQDGLDAVFVTSPDFLHEEHSIAALSRGIAVYLEKPMAITIEGCDRILQAAKDHKAKLYLGHNMRHMSFVLKMKELVDAGVIGRVTTAWCRHFVCYGGDAYFKDWHSERKYATGLLLQKAAHDIDVMHWICGGFAVRVQAMGGLTVYNQIQDRRKPDEKVDPSFNSENWPPLSQKKLSPHIDVEDLSLVNMQLDNGVYVAYQQCMYTPDACRNYTFIGTEGRIENFGDAPPDCSIHLWNTRKGYTSQGDVQYPINLEDGSHGGADPRIVQEFIQYVRDDVPPTTSPVAARYSVAAGYMATMSLRDNGMPKDVPPLDPELAAWFNGK